MISYKSMPVSISVLAFGLLLGLRHATDADHVVAITTISTKEKDIKESALIGLLWGIGHSITVTLIGIPIIFFSLKIPSKILLALEFNVGIMLVVLGLVNLYSARRKIEKTLTSIFHKHSHPHFNAKEHSHFHIHYIDNANNKTHHLSFLQTARPIFVGLIHGLAGSAAISILIISTIRSPIIAAFYLVIFHIGVIVGMMTITTLLSASINKAGQKLSFLRTCLVVGSGVLSLIFGIYIVYEISFTQGLLM